MNFCVCTTRWSFAGTRRACLAPNIVGACNALITGFAQFRRNNITHSGMQATSLLHAYARVHETLLDVARESINRNWLGKACVYGQASRQKASMFES